MNRRIFVTGAPRSGTTILQAILQSFGYKNPSFKINIENLEDHKMRLIIESAMQHYPTFLDRLKFRVKSLAVTGFTEWSQGDSNS